MVSRTPHLSWTARTSPSGSNPRGCRSQAKTLVENMGSWSKENVDFTENDGFGMNFIDFLGMEGSCKCSLQVWNIPKNTCWSTATNWEWEWSQRKKLRPTPPDPQISKPQSSYQKPPKITKSPGHPAPLVYVHPLCDYIYLQHLHIS